MQTLVRLKYAGFLGGLMHMHTVDRLQRSTRPRGCTRSGAWPITLTYRAAPMRRPKCPTHQDARLSLQVIVYRRLHRLLLAMPQTRNVQDIDMMLILEKFNHRRKKIHGNW